MPRILITGIDGVIGSALARALRHRGGTVSGLDRRSSGDIRDRTLVEASVQRADGVVHLAALSRVDEAEVDPATCWSVNVDGTRSVVDAARAHGAWVLFASSREVYGNPAALPVTERTPLAPINVYGRSKAAAEAIVGRHPRACVLRLANVYGSPEDYPGRVVPAFAQAAAAGRDLRVHGPHRRLDVVHIDDVVDGFVTAIDQLIRGAVPPTVHLMTGRPVTLGDLASTAVTLAGTSSPIRHCSANSHHVTDCWGDPALAASELGWRPRVALIEGMARLINSFRLEVAS